MELGFLRLATTCGPRITTKAVWQSQLMFKLEDRHCDSFHCKLDDGGRFSKPLWREDRF
jgi:hypothetical protein